jgi:hypothetical protein
VALLRHGVGWSAQRISSVPSARTIDGMSDVASATLGWVRTPSGGKVHLPQCTHLSVSTELLPVPEPEDLDAPGVCGSCADEARGIGRTYYDTFEDALRQYQAPLDNRPRYRQVAAQHEYDTIWIPRSRSYIGIAQGNARAAAYFGKGYIWTYESGLEEMPNYAGASSGAAAGAAERPAQLCPVCHQALPATGVCDEHGRPPA